MDKKTQGAWLIHHTNKLQGVTNQQGYEKTFVAGKAGILLSAISADNELLVNKPRLDVLARASGVNILTELPVILDVLRSRDLIDVSKAGEVAVLGVTSASVLQHTFDIFSAQTPSNVEEAAIALAEIASIAPVLSSEATEELSDIYELTSDEAGQLIQDANQIGFTDSENYGNGKFLLFNGNLFRRDSTQKTKAVLDSLNQVEQSALTDFVDTLRRKACIDVDSAIAILGKPLFDKTSSIGLFDINVVNNNSSSTGFVTLPSAFSKYSTSMVEDAFDLAKAFLSSITYGMTKSYHARGKIRMVEVLLSSLVQGDSVGPADAIAHDYKVLEFKGVVQVYSGQKKGRSGPMLRLLKKEVGELALQAIRQGDVSEHSLISLPTATLSGYIGPEVNRYKARQLQLQSSPKATNDMLAVLRKGGI